MMLDELSKNLSPRLLFLLLTAIAVVILSLGYSGLFRQPIKELRQLENRLLEMQRSPVDLQAAEDRIRKLRQEIASLNRKLTDTGREVLKGTKPSSVIADLGANAEKYGVQLLNVMPGTPNKGRLYTEVPFQMDLSGSYHQLFNWVYAVERDSKPLTVRQFSIRSGAGGNQRLLHMTIVLIQPKKET